jgi:hypothetical protein
LRYTTKEGRKKRKRRSVREEASVAVLLLLPQAALGAALHIIIIAGNDGTPSALLSHLVLPQRASWLATPSTAPLSRVVSSADGAVLVHRSKWHRGASKSNVTWL